MLTCSSVERRVSTALLHASRGQRGRRRQRTRMGGGSPAVEPLRQPVEPECDISLAERGKGLLLKREKKKAWKAC